MKQEWLEEIKKRHKAVPTGPWAMVTKQTAKGDTFWMVNRSADSLHEQMPIASRICTKDRAEFITHSWQDIQALLAEVERLRYEWVRSVPACQWHYAVTVFLWTLGGAWERFWDYEYRR